MRSPIRQGPGREPARVRERAARARSGGSGAARTLHLNKGRAGRVYASPGRAMYRSGVPHQETALANRRAAVPQSARRMRPPGVRVTASGPHGARVQRRRWRMCCCGAAQSAGDAPCSNWRMWETTCSGSSRQWPRGITLDAHDARFRRIGDDTASAFRHAQAMSRTHALQQTL